MRFNPKVLIFLLVIFGIFAFYQYDNILTQANAKMANPVGNGNAASQLELKQEAEISNLKKRLHNLEEKLEKLIPENEETYSRREREGDGDERQGHKDVHKDMKKLPFHDIKEREKEIEREVRLEMQREKEAKMGDRESAEEQKHHHHGVGQFSNSFKKDSHKDEDYSKMKIDEKAIEMCNTCFWSTYRTTTVILPKENHSYVFTGDIDDMWIRDSSAQVHPYIPFAKKAPKFQRLIEGLLRRQAMYIIYDPYGNSYRIDTNYKFSAEQIALGRHGYVATFNYELDSGCYYLRLMYKYWKAVPDTPVIHEKSLRDAADALVKLWKIEQNHERDSPYRYIELPRNGLGSPVGYTGMSWTGFRPSDNQPIYGYLVPANMFAVVALGYLVEISRDIWGDHDLADRAQTLKEEIDAGIQKYAIIDDHEFGKVYAFEVDGLGHFTFMDDANIPSLLSIPYLEYSYDPEIYANTRRLIMSKRNPYYYEGMYAKGIGSSHAKQGHIWHMAVVMQGLTTDDPTEKQEVLDMLTRTDAGTNQMHEGFNPNNPREFTRSWFAWSNALFAEFTQSVIALKKHQHFDTSQEDNDAFIESLIGVCPKDIDEVKEITGH